ncbi:hypothetical protein JTB14_005242 [Gonioctena quinquepunctata]|nr:hypothetical protein JTB14_005242 [Gonioctena quinquepunctata]
MAENGREFLEQSKPQVDKDTRIRSLKDRQNEERQRKLEEIKAQALAAQRFKEQKEHERRRRLEEMRVKDEARRYQVEERKKAINDAERDRLEFILRRNQDREQRIDTKRRNERSSAVFAFGSSTPRMLEPTDLTPSFWGHRRATSIQNITSSTNSASSYTRRQSERDLDAGNKKRATSATGLERTGEGTVPVIPAGCASGYTGRRRTDLIPTIPSRDPSFSSSRKSLNHSPGRAYSMTRLDQLAKPRRRPDLPSLAESNPFDPPRPLSSTTRVSPITRSMSHLASSKLGPSVTRRNLSKEDSRSLHQLAGDGGVFLAPRTTRTSQLREQKLHASSNCSEASSRPSSSLSQQSTNSVTSSVSVRHRLTATSRKPRPASIAITGVTQDLKSDKPPLPKTKKTHSKSSFVTERVPLKSKAKSPVDNVSKTIKNTVVQSVASKDETQQKPPDTAPVIQPKPEENHVHPPEKVPAPTENLKEDSNKENVPEIKKSDIELVSESKAVDKVEKVTVEEKETKIVEAKQQDSFEAEKKDISKDSNDAVVKDQKSEKKDETEDKSGQPEITMNPAEVSIEPLIETTVADSNNPNVENSENNSNIMTASMTKIRITTEEEAKAALAEKRRLMREETERQAETERLRLEAEAKAEFEKQQREEEQVRQMVELQRQTEQQRLQEAIKEVQKREEEEKLKREEEQRLKQLKEEAELKAKEDAERQKAELQERLKNEEKEREARRKRVEAIMLRTRGKNNANLPSQQSTDDKNENKSEVENKVVEEESKVNGTKIVEQQENGTSKSAKDEEIVDNKIVDNIIPSEIVKNANNTVTIETMNSSDSINSNNSWRDSQQYDSLM